MIRLCGIGDNVTQAVSVDRGEGGAGFRTGRGNLSVVYNKLRTELRRCMAGKEVVAVAEVDLRR